MPWILAWSFIGAKLCQVGQTRIFCWKHWSKNCINIYSVAMSTLSWQHTLACTSNFLRHLSARKKWEKFPHSPQKKCDSKKKTITHKGGARGANMQHNGALVMDAHIFGWLILQVRDSLVKKLWLKMQKNALWSSSSNSSSRSNSISLQLNDNRWLTKWNWAKGSLYPY